MVPRARDVSPRFVRVFEPATVLEIVQVKLALEGSGIPYYIHNENYMAATGVPFSLGAMQAFVLVPEDRAKEASELLADWFGR